MNFIDMFLVKLGDRKLLAEPSSVVGLLASSDETTRKQGVEQLTKLLASLVTFYKETIFPLVRTNIDHIVEDAKEDIKEALSYGVDVRSLFLDGEVSMLLRDMVVPKQATSFGKFNVTIGTGAFNVDHENPFIDLFGALSGERKKLAINTLNDLIEGTVDIDDIIIGENGHTKFSDLVIIVNSMSYDKEPEGTMGKVDDYRATLAILKNNFNYYAAKVSLAITRAVENNDLVFGKGEGYLTLYAPVLESYYDQGGTIEGLYGFYLSEAKHISLQAILAKHDLLKRSYEDEYRRMMISKKSVARDVYIHEYTKFVSAHVRNKEMSGNIITKVNTHLNSLSDIELSNVKDRVEEIVVDFLYPESGARRFVDSIDFFKKDIDNTEELIGLAVMDLAVDYVVNGIYVQ